MKRKYEEKFFWSVFDWMGRKENKKWNLSVFSPDSPKVLSPIWRKNGRE